MAFSFGVFFSRLGLGLGFRLGPGFGLGLWLGLGLWFCLSLGHGPWLRPWALVVALAFFFWRFGPGLWLWLSLGP